MHINLSPVKQIPFPTSEHQHVVFCVLGMKPRELCFYILLDRQWWSSERLNTFASGSEDDIPIVTFYYDFPPQHSDDPLLTMMVSGTMNDGSTKQSSQTPQVDIKKNRKSPLGQGLQAVE